MGVHGLWELLAPVGRRVSVETLAGKTLAVDASIWMVQFVKAMRDEKGEMVRNAHLLGFFRRICKLLFLRTKPVFIFDGGTPALKRRTVIARRRQRENAQAKVRKTAEKLLLNHLKALRLKELADDVKNQRMKQNSDTKGQKKSIRKDTIGSNLERSHVKELDEMSVETAKEETNGSVSTSCNQEKLDEMLAVSIAAEENKILAEKGMLSAVINHSQKEYDSDEEIILPSVDAEIDMAVLAALPQSMQLDILTQLKGKKTEGPVKEVGNQKQNDFNDRGKGKGILLSETDRVECSSRHDNVISKSDNQDTVDEVLAASIAVEENEKLTSNLSTSIGASNIEEEEDDYDENEEMVLPDMHGKVDPTVLASLPPSMQLDLLVQMRERLIAENRQKYQKVKKDPAKFSELQIQAYLKTVAFRRDIDEVQKTAAGGGVGGVRTSRIASEANREYIFSSTFTGDKQELTSTRSEKNKDTQQKAHGTHPLQNFANCFVASNDSNTSGGLVHNESSEPVGESVQTYLDERGRFRVSRLRAMGMRMTRDIQRNLDLMKEIEQERAYVNKAAHNGSVKIPQNNDPSECSGIQNVVKSGEVNVHLDGENVENEQAMLVRDTPLEINFEYDCKSEFVNGHDDIFSSLVGGNPVFWTDDAAETEQLSHSDPDCDWEEGIVEGKGTVFSEHDKVELKSSAADEDNNDESEVEWEEGDGNGANNGLLSGRSASRGLLEEESDLQEAIRRSLESVGDVQLKCMSSLDEHSNASENKLNCSLEYSNDLHRSGQVDLSDNVGFLNNEHSMEDSNVYREDSTEQKELHEIEVADKMNGYVTANSAQTLHNHGIQSKSSMTFNSSDSQLLIDKPSRMEPNSFSKDSISDAYVMMKDEVPLAGEQLFDEHNDGKVSFLCKNTSKVDILGATEVEKESYIKESEPLDNSTNNTEPAIHLKESSLKVSNENPDIGPKFLAEDNNENFYEEKISSGLCTDGVNSLGDYPGYEAEGRLEEEIQILGQEYINLENEQRKLERNAESVNSELFTECQELLQMFGLPYIIAPMEAEAQCAYLEIAKLVDGVVTDDSDVLLFGARNVYKNIFDDRKYVETYFMEDVEKELGLSREKLIRMALLLGSDYTEGVSGIGIVNAIEVVNAFPEEDGLLKFRQWVESPDPTILGRLDAKSGSNTKKKGPKSNCNVKESAVDQDIPQGHEEMEDPIQQIKQTFFNKHRNVSKNWNIPSSFPSETVMSAYNSPQVDRSTEPFSWGKPDHLVLRKLCWEKFGWTGQKADELLLPVLKEYNKRETQLRLEAFYSFNERFAKIRSKRIKKAVKGITGKQPSELLDDYAEELPESRKNGAEIDDNKLETSRGTEESLEDRRKSKIKQSRKRKNGGDTVSRVRSKKKIIIDDPSSAPGTSHGESLQMCKQTEEQQHDGKVLMWNRTGRGRGRGRGDTGIKKGKEKGSLSFQSRETETSSGSSDIADSGPRVLVDKLPTDLQMSLRSRKPVNYYFEGHEVEDAEDSFDQSNKTLLHEEPIKDSLSHIPRGCEDGATDFSMGKECSTMNIPQEEDNLTRDLTSEGLFQNKADETSQAWTGNRDSSDEYLKMGGGFCLEDTETGDKHNAIDDVNTAAVDYTTDFPHTSDFLDKIELEKSSDILFSGSGKDEKERQSGLSSCAFNKEPNDLVNASSDDHSDIGVLIAENSRSNSGLSTGAFRGMPFLRKRRKKN